MQKRAFRIFAALVFAASTIQLGNPQADSLAQNLRYMGGPPQPVDYHRASER